MEIFASIEITLRIIRNLIYAHPYIFFLGLAVLTFAITAWSRDNAIKKGILKFCPHCREKIDGEATVCRFCQRDIA